MSGISRLILSNNKVFNLMQNLVFKSIGISYLIFNLIVFSGSLLSLNLDDNREDPFKDINDFESVVYVKIGNSICSGVLIDHRTVLTAAHCMIEGQKAVISSENEVTDNTVTFETTSFVKIPEDRRYSLFTGASYDMALISLKDPFLNVEPLNMKTELPNINSEVFISGYGLHGTGSLPDQEFDGKKRWGKNILSIISLESSINGPSISNTPDKIILGFYFDQNFDSNESMISLGDSGSPLLLKENDNYLVAGIASWVKKDIVTQNRGYGSSAGFSSVQQNLDWIMENNPLRKISSLSDGSWNDQNNWNDSSYPDNYLPELDNYNTQSARYYSVEVINKIDIKDTITIDSLNIRNEAYLTVEKNGSLEVLLNSALLGSNFKNKGVFITNNFSIDAGTYTNLKDTLVRDELRVLSGSLKNNATISASNIIVIGGKISGTGIFKSKIFHNKGSIYPGEDHQSIGNLTFNSSLKNEGKIELDINRNQESDLIIADRFFIAGNLSINPISQFYSGNTYFKLITYDESDGERFSEVNYLENNFGRLSKNLIYGENSIDLSLMNPSYELLGLDHRSKEIGIYIDSFSKNTSGNFQNLLDKINYAISDQEASNSLNNLVLLNNYEHFLERIEMTHDYLPEGVFISESEFENKKGNFNYKSDLNIFNINLKNLSFAYYDVDSLLNNTNERETANSNAYKLEYKIPFIWFDLFFGFYEEKRESKNNRLLKLNDLSEFKGNHTRDIKIDRLSLQMQKSFNMQYGLFRTGVSFYKTSIQTDPFKETLNSIINNYRVNDMNINTFKPYVNYSREYIYGKNKMSIGIDINKYFHNEDNIKSVINIDNSDDDLILNEPLEISEDMQLSFYITNTFNDSVYAKLSFSKRNDNEMTMLKIGYLF